jgi:hypothetical protein
MTRTFFLTLILVGTLPALAQTTQPALISVVRMTIHPAAEPQPALKYQLLPPILEQTPGNAALLYHTAILLSSDYAVRRNLNELIETPANKLPALKPFEDRLCPESYAFLRYIEMASRREKCDWDRPLSEGANILLPELGAMRYIGRFIETLTRYRIAQGRFDAAIHSLQTGFSIARHTTEGLGLITDVVGIAIGNIMVNRVEKFIQVPGAPNLYWALTSLPTPFVDLRKSAQQEALFVYRLSPGLINLETKPLTPQEYRTLIDKMATLFEKFKLESIATGEVPAPPSKNQAEKIESGIKKDYPDAKRYLLAHGKTQKMIEAMPVSQVVLLYYLRTFEQSRDDIHKWINIPYWQTREQVRLAEKRILTLEKEMKNNYFFQGLTLWDRAYFAATKLDRQIAVLRCIEAIRMYAANHSNKLPGSLNDITEVPLPNNPLTGRAFIYSAQGDKAVLEAPAPPGAKADTGKRYEITLIPNQ